MTKPIKRDKRLVPLSHDHHGGLLFAWKLKQGVAKQADLEMMRRYMSYYWENDMQRHFTKEEELLIPALDPSNTLRNRVLEEHKQIKNLLSDCEKEPTYEKIKSLSQLVHDHIRFEERNFFPYIEENISNEQLNEIGKVLQEEPEFCDNWPSEFWK